MTTIELTGAAPMGAAETRTRKRIEMSPQFLARLTGVLFIVTYITSIAALAVFYAPALSDPNYVLGTGPEGGLAWGALLEMLLIIANVGTALALFPVLKRQSEWLALGYVTARLVESGFIAVGIVSLLALSTLRLEAGGADAGTLTLVAKALVAIHDWTFLLGPGFVVGVGNGLMLGYLMFTSRLVPRALAVLGLIGGPLIVLSGTAMLFGLIELGSVWQAVATVPEFFWELLLGIWLLVKGFNPSALAALPPADGTR
jgi:hypothetical protein